MKKFNLYLQQILVVLSLISILVFVYFYSTSKSEKTVYGKVIDFSAKVNDTGIHSFLIVKSEDNKTLKVSYTKASKRDIGKKVVLKEFETNFFDIKKYSFSRFEN